MRVNLALVSALIGCVALAACSGTSARKGQQDRPQIKPENLSVQFRDDRGQLSRARVSTKSGDLLILEPDGSVTQLSVDRLNDGNAFAVDEAALAGLDVNLSLDLSHVPTLPTGSIGFAATNMTAQQRALEAFAARTEALLPRNLPALPAEAYIGSHVEVLDAGTTGRDGMIAVTANLARGVDADAAFAYATCALAGWAEANDAGFARHVRTISDKDRGKVRIHSVFTLSKGDRPMGLKVMTPGDAVTACKAGGIPRA